MFTWNRAKPQILEFSGGGNDEPDLHAKNEQNAHVWNTHDRFHAPTEATPHARAPPGHDHDDARDRDAVAGHVRSSQSAPHLAHSERPHIGTTERPLIGVTAHRH
jgi:hypothetical protein